MTNLCQHATWLFSSATHLSQHATYIIMLMCKITMLTCNLDCVAWTHNYLASRENDCFKNPIFYIKSSRVLFLD